MASTQYSKKWGVMAERLWALTQDTTVMIIMHTTKKQELWSWPICRQEMNVCVSVVCVCLFVCRVPQRCLIFWWCVSSQDADLLAGHAQACFCCALECVYMYVCQCEAYGKDFHPSWCVHCQVDLSVGRRWMCVSAVCLFVCVQCTTKLTHLLVVHLVKMTHLLAGHPHVCFHCVFEFVYVLHQSGAYNKVFIFLGVCVVKLTNL